jgi:hypothetical protein
MAISKAQARADVHRQACQNDERADKRGSIKYNGYVKRE